ncbi:MAG TPA: hypothetical protein VD838_03445, partial [Anaeromyxobacteraceae bacterium]|nr:hypothetical protein [Anaeromyxobacteraceae bacterium]
MVLSSALALLLAAPTPGGAIAAALAVPGARAELDAVRPAVGRGCAPTGYEAPRPVTASGQVALRVTGR